jgi:hypothetical protein
VTRKDLQGYNIIRSELCLGVYRGVQNRSFGGLSRNNLNGYTLVRTELGQGNSCRSTKSVIRCSELEVLSGVQNRTFGALTIKYLQGYRICLSVL